MPPLQIKPLGHTVLQLPQWLASVCKVVQIPEQIVWPLEHSALQVPLEQTWPDAQTLVQLPQWFGSNIRLTHAPAQAVSLAGQFVVQTPDLQTSIEEQA
jgi:hypothetical protein